MRSPEAQSVKSGNALDQIVEGDCLTADALYWVFAHMTFPEDVITAERIAIAMRDDIATLGEYTLVSELGEREFLKRQNSGRLCGWVAVQLVRNQRDTGKPDLMKAQYVVSEFAHPLRTREGRPVASDLRNLKRKFKDMKPALHLWAAHEILLEDRDYKGIEGTLPEILTTPEELELLLKVAAWFEVELTPLIADWCPLRIPERFMSAVQRGEFKVNLPQNPPEVDAILRTYRNKGPNG